MKGLILGFITFYVILPNNVFAQCYDNVQTVYSSTTPCNNQSWVLYFEDNFEENSLDESKWVYPYQGVIAGYDFSGWKNWYANTATTPSKPISDNVVVENGYLKLIARKENPPISGTYQNWSNGGALTTSSFDYSSGWIESKKEFGYGWYEIRCKIPKGRGLWPAFWLYDENTVSKASEIDIFEFWNESTCLGSYDPTRLSKNPHFNIHSSKINSGSSTCPGVLHNCGGSWNVDGTDFSDIFHTFAVEWDYFKIIWYIDGQPVQYRYRFNTLSLQNIDCNSLQEGSIYYLNESWPFTDRMQVRFNMALQQGYTNPAIGSGYNKAPDGTTPFPSAFEIDYFRYYKRGPCSANVTITSDPQLNLSNILYNTLLGQNITISSAVTVNNNEQLEVIPSNQLILDPGFEVENGSEFFAHIDPVYCNINTSMVGVNEHQEKIPDKYQEQENTFLGINALDNLDVLKIYPNPGTDHVIIELTSSKGLNLIEITDNQGRQLLNDTRELNEAMNLDISTFSPGTYIIKILNKETGKVYLERFTKNK